MLHKHHFNYIDKTLRFVCDSQRPFGGKCVVIGGDWRQLCPVVVGGKEADQVAASVKTDPQFSLFERLR